MVLNEKSMSKLGNFGTAQLFWLLIPGDSKLYLLRSEEAAAIMDGRMLLILSMLCGFLLDTWEL